MKDLKNTLAKIYKISEKPLMFLAGLGALWASEVRISQEELQTLVRVMGCVTLAFGVIPMFVSFAKEIWKTK